MITSQKTSHLSFLLAIAKSFWDATEIIFIPFFIHKYIHTSVSVLSRVLLSMALFNINIFPLDQLSLGMKTILRHHEATMMKDLQGEGYLECPNTNTNGTATFIGSKINYVIIPNRILYLSCLPVHLSNKVVLHIQMPHARFYTLRFNLSNKDTISFLFL